MYSETNLLFQQLIDHAFAFKQKGGGRTRKLIARAGWGVGWAAMEAHPLACFSSSNACPGASQPAHGPPHLPRLAPSNEGRCERQKANRKTNLKEGLNSWPCKYGIYLLLLGSDSTQRASVCISSAVSQVAPRSRQRGPRHASVGALVPSLLTSQWTCGIHHASTRMRPPQPFLTLCPQTECKLSSE